MKKVIYGIDGKGRAGVLSVQALSGKAIVKLWIEFGNKKMIFENYTKNVKAFPIEDLLSFTSMEDHIFNCLEAEATSKIMCYFEKMDQQHKNQIEREKNFPQFQQKQIGRYCKNRQKYGDAFAVTDTIIDYIEASQKNFK